MKPWEVKKTVKKIRRLSADSLLTNLSEFHRFSSELFIRELKNDKRKLTNERILLEARRLIWDDQPKISKKLQKKLSKYLTE